jgi:hypothetical protein
MHNSARSFLNILTICLWLIAGPAVSCRKSTEDNIPLQKESHLKIQELKSSSGAGVVNVDRLRFRSDNDLHSKTLRYLDRGTIVEIIKRDKGRVRIGEMEDYWYQINYDGITGWVFGYYLDIYSTIDQARAGSKRFKSGLENSDESVNSYEPGIDNALFFIRNGKLVQVINGEIGKAKVIATVPGTILTNYYFSSDRKTIYYIGKQSISSRENGTLYRYSIPEEKNTVLSKNIFAASYDPADDQFLTVSRQKSISRKNWLITILDVERKGQAGKTYTIPIQEESHEQAQDIFTNTLRREKGSLVTLEKDEKGEFIYFKPPEENQTYLISLTNGDYIQTDYDMDPAHRVDQARTLSIKTSVDYEGKSLYSVILTDIYSGMVKELITSPLFPISFTVSNYQNYVAISMVNTAIGQDADIYPSSVYVLSLNTYAMIPISTDGISYQPGWHYE